MSDFINIAEARQNLKGSITGIIIKETDLKAGTSNGKDWTKKTFTIQDESDTIDITTWGEDTNKFKVGLVYQIVSPWWKMYEGKAQLSLGKYAQVTLIGSDKQTNITKTAPKTTTLAQKSITDPKQTATLSHIAKDLHDEAWAFAVFEATKVYPVENVQIPDSSKVRDLNLKDRMILAQVFYKKNMDYIIHRGTK